MKRIHTQVLRWYKANGRTLPWRATTVPYRILVSEIMLQQTQANRAGLFYKKWIQRFPSFNAVAQASKAEVLRQWSGLGYNNRAVRFHRLAKTVVDEYRGRLPETLDELEQLPGIGKYTSHAIACFSFHDNVPVVDINIRRIITRMTRKIRSSSDLIPERNAWDLAETLLPPEQAYTWNQALMDIGSLFCTARRPNCSGCPLKSTCLSAFSNAFLRKVVLKKKTEPSFNGIPRRIIRGKILKALHDEPMTLTHLAQLISQVRNKRIWGFLRLTISQMESDGLVTLAGRGQRMYVTIAE